MPFYPRIFLPDGVKPCPICRRYICDHPENTSAKRAMQHIELQSRLIHRAIYGDPINPTNPNHKTGA